RPRESHELRLISSQITTWPPSTLTWAQDTFGNAIATATFQEPAEKLVIESDVTLELNSDAWPVFPIAARAITYPFSYSQEERTDLGALLSCQYPNSMGRVSAWAAGFVLGNPTDTLARTLDLGRGSCRDFAVVFVEAARALGFGARLVSGYNFAPALQDQAGTTHA